MLPKILLFTFVQNVVNNLLETICKSQLQL